MRPSRLWTALAIVAVAALAAGGIAAATDGGDPADEKRGERSREGFVLPAPPMLLHERGERRDQFAKDLAEELDIEVDEVKQALRAVLEKNLNRAVDDGRLTRKQADRILECHDEEADDEDCRPPRIGHPPLPPGPGFGHGFRGERGLHGRFERLPKRLRERLERFRERLDRRFDERFERGRPLPLPPHAVPAPPGM